MAELTLRPLAARAGTTLARVTQEMGQKEALIEELVATAAREDEAFHREWLARLASLTVSGVQMRALVVEAALDDWINRKRHLACLMIEMVQEYGRRNERCPNLEAWLGDAGGFWAEMLFDDPRYGMLAMGYILDETGFSLGAGGDARYILLRGMCLRRLISGIFPGAGEEAGWSANVEQIIAMLRPEESEPTELDTSKRGTIAAEAGRLIVARGVEAVTHRSVAAAASVPASTVAYHFGSRDEMVVAGLHAIVTRFRHGLRAGADQGQASTNSFHDLAKATSIIALAASRHPGLRPYALDMRRRRGENMDRDGLHAFGLPTDRGFDRCTAQVLSIAVFGMAVLGMAQGPSEGVPLGDVFTQLAEKLH